MKLDKEKLRNTAADIVLALIALTCIGVGIWIWIGIFEWIIKHYRP